MIKGTGAMLQTQESRQVPCYDLGSLDFALTFDTARMNLPMHYD
jgi:hypothetical protein